MIHFLKQEIITANYKSYCLSDGIRNRKSDIVGTTHSQEGKAYER